jgi:hypothetical protein
LEFPQTGDNKLGTTQGIKQLSQHVLAVSVIFNLVTFLAIKKKDKKEPDGELTSRFDKPCNMLKNQTGHTQTGNPDALEKPKEKDLRNISWLREESGIG